MYLYHLSHLPPSCRHMYSPWCRGSATLSSFLSIIYVDYDYYVHRCSKGNVLFFRHSLLMAAVSSKRLEVSGESQPHETEGLQGSGDPDSLEMLPGEEEIHQTQAGGHHSPGSLEGKVQ